VPRIVRNVVLVCILALVACAEPAVRVDVSGSAAGLELGDLEATVRTLQEKLTSLAAAMPEEDLNWRPMDGVRSVGEVYVHIAADNWYVPALLGWQAPAETGVTSDGATFQAYQSRTMERDELLRALDASFEFLLASMADSADDLAREVTLGTPTTVGDVWIRATVHLHEHLGQSIAYARMNEIVPPWSR
jgi:hypothetical protein